MIIEVVVKTMNDFAPQQDNQNKVKQPDMSYFGAMRKKFNADNIVWYLKPEQIQKAAKDRIFREMVSGAINYSENGKYFQDSKFLENLIIAAQNELTNNIIIRDALRMYTCMFPGYMDAGKLVARYENLSYIMNIILNKLNEVKFTGNIGVLTDIQRTIGHYKNLL
jgi:hypothetical protein